MPRISYEQMAASVRETIDRNGGEMTHNDLVASLEAAGQGSYALRLVHMAGRGDIKARVVAVAVDQPAQVFYTLPNAPQSVTPGGES